jgi:hypothetical protein
MTELKEKAWLAAIVGFFIFAAFCALVSDDPMDWSSYALLGGALAYGSTLMVGHISKQVLEDQADDSDEQEDQDQPDEYSEASDDESDENFTMDPAQEAPPAPGPEMSPDTPARTSAAAQSPSDRLRNATAAANATVDKEPGGE